MEIPKENQLQLVVSSSTAPFQDLVDSQKELFRSQIDQLQNIVVSQCKLTGVNPLSQEMAAGALSIKIGKRPRDLLNPKAMKYMQAIFSIKDATSKRESRDISALFGVTATQVREFFTGQRSRVRRFIRLSREKAVRSNACKNELEEPLCSDPNVIIDSVPLNTVCPANNEGPSCSTQDEVLPGMNDLDKHFVENIFILMRKEEKFSGQVKLMEWILQIQNASVLHWFLTKGGVMILATWLSQAAVEEQTTILHVIIKVLCHLPLHKALPAHMSAILQSVNKLRFYRSSDIANRAKVLLSKWSKIFARSQSNRKPNAMKSSSEVQDEMLLKQSIGEIMGNESWETKSDNHQETSTQCYAGAENLRKLESSQPLKLLTSSADDSNKKLIRGSSSQTRERRKVQLVEQPGQKATGRSSQVARPVPATQGRPLSADDIQKAKMRAQFMQSKYEKLGMTSDGGPNKGSSPQVSVSTSASRSYVCSKAEEIKKPVKIVSSESIQQVAPIDNRINLDLDEPLWKKCKRVQILWQTPPEMRINSGWMIGTGENSKEVDIQNNRIRREKEIIYKTVQEIPPNPKEPWDREMDYDDSLTPEIPTEQLPDVEGKETVVSPRESEEIPVNSAATTSQSSNGNRNRNGNGNGNGNVNMAEPDLELLAVLLKNPELVFALTSAEGGGSLSSEDTMKLLDMLKSNGVNSQGSLTGVATKVEEKVEVSLPSPTPSSNPVTSGWGSEFAKNPFSRQSATVNGEVNHMPAVMAASVQSQIPSTSMVAPQRRVIVPPPAQPITSQLPSHHGATSTTLPEKRARLEVPSLNQNAPEIFHSKNKFPAGNLPLPNLSAAASPSMRVETLGNVNPAHFPVTQQASYPLPPVMPRPAQPQVRRHPSMIPEPRLSTPLWRERQDLASSSHSHASHNNYNAYAGGPLQARMQQPGPPRNGNEMMVDPWYESWSPDNSPIRSQPGWNYEEPRMNVGPNYRFPRPRPRNPEYRDLGRNENRRWRDQRR